MKRYSAVILLLLTSLAAGPAVRAQVLQIDEDGVARKIAQGWYSSTASSRASSPEALPRQVIPAGSTGGPLRLMLNSGSGRLLEYGGPSPFKEVRNYVITSQDRRSVLPAAGSASAASTEYAHIRNVDYDPDAVISLTGCFGFQTTVEFAAGEHIENVGLGAASRWLLVPNRRADTLFVEPASPSSHTNMTVVTDRHRYYFDLVARDSEACRRGAVVYGLRLRYPTVDKPIQQTAEELIPSPGEPLHLASWRTP